MSWKGFKKAVDRLPYTLLSKKNEGTKDPEYLGLHKNFKELSHYVDTLADDARIFRDSIAALLSNQAAMAQYLAIIYDTNLGTDVPEGMVPKRFQPTAAANLQSVNDAEAAMAYCRDEVLPELDVVDRDIVRPLMELTEILKTIHKTMTKRDHKLIDYDRHRIALQKLNQKQERSFSEEKQVFKLQSQLDVATQDYNYLNEMLKAELPKFFKLKASFIQPVFENLYNMQCRIYGMIYARCYELLNQNLESFVTNTMGIEEGYNYRKSQRDVRNEMENLDLLKSGGKAWLAASGGQNNSKLSLQDRAALRAAEQNGVGSPPPAYGNVNGTTVDATPMSYGKQDYSQQQYLSPQQQYQQPYQQQSPQQQYQQPYQQQPSPQQQYQSPPPPPPPPAAAGGNAQYVIALYDYTAQADGDLSFRKDDKIEILERTQDQNDWWTGRLNGKTGVFPGNYVADY